jgi:hypothetical protein
MKLKICLALAPLLVYALYRVLHILTEMKKRKDDP